MKLIIAVVLTLGFVNLAHGEQSTAEKAAAKGNDVERAVKKKVHRVEEAFCAEGDAKCLAKKAKHRGQEGAEYLKDKTNEAVDKVDRDSKP